jgi:D-arabinose 1-dehydrogenase-like Zn-dependent alcohol dehydrogenase
VRKVLALSPGRRRGIQASVTGLCAVPQICPNTRQAYRRACDHDRKCAANHSYLRDLGADEVIDYNARDFTQVVTGCDAVFDTVGGDVAQRSFAVLKPGGRDAFIASSMQAPKPERDDVRSLRPPVERARRHLERIAYLFLSGAIRAPEIKLYRLSEASDAHRLSESRHFRGKLVFQGVETYACAEEAWSNRRKWWRNSDFGHAQSH